MSSVVYTVEIRNQNGRPEIIEFEGPDGLTEQQITRLADTHLRTARPGQQFPHSVIDSPPVHGSGIVDARPSDRLANAVGLEAATPVLGAVDQLAGLAQGAGHVLDNAAGLAESAYNNTLGYVFGQSDSATRANEAGQGFEGLADTVGQGGEFGDTLGQIATSAYLTRGLPGPLAQAAGSGALMSEAETPLGFAADVVGSGAAGKIGDLAVRGVSALVAPQVERGVRYLADRGVRMTPGQIIPSLQRTEERLISRPFVGDQIAEGRRQSVRDFNRAAIDEVVAPYNAVSSAPVRVPEGAGSGVVRDVGNQLSERYDRLVPGLQLVPDSELANDITALGGTLANGDLSPTAVQQFERIVRNQVMSRLSGGPLNGEAYRQIERNLGNQIRRYSRSTSPDDQAMAAAFEELQGAFQRGLQRSNPHAAQELGALNESWANLVRVEGAASGARAGIFSPQQFRQAVRSTDRSTRGRAMARGEARMQDLAEAAVDVLPTDYPDSGTSGRAQMSVFDPRYYVGLGQSLLYGPTAQRGVQTALLSPRPPGAQTVANALRLLPAPQASAFGALGISGPLLQPVPYAGQ